MAPAPLLSVRDLSVSFDTPGGEVRAVRHVSFDLARGETVGARGRERLGQVGDRAVDPAAPALPAGAAPVRAASVFQGQELLGADEATLRQVRGNRIAMIFQEPMTSLNPLHTIEKQVNEVLFVHKGLGRRAARARTLELLRLVGLPEAERRLDAYPHQLSGGQRQRVMIAMALANEPDLLIADEPTTALDVTIQAQILKLLRDLQARFGMALLLITHDLGIVRKMADRVCVMSQGEIVEAGADGRDLRAAAAPVHAAPAGRRARAAAPAAAGADAPVVMTAEDVKVWFPIKARRAAAHGRPRQGGGRRERHGPRGPDGRRRGRERLGQDHARAGAAAAPPERRADPVPRAASSRALGARRAAAAAPGDADGLPGPVRVAVAAACRSARSSGEGLGVHHIGAERRGAARR